MQETYGTNYSSVFDRRHAYQEMSDPSASRRQHIFHRIHTSSSARVTRITINSLLRESPHTPADADRDQDRAAKKEMM
ncbi:hypothetical protein L916_00354 [Phytophthora nicotianae]|uniref:Uncharacterized protein n=1 Tax=Phytophthora nicotianae TaxID=4792 RepID=W2JVE9_PHYNI|nr:hypothetical protein L916_00354 [Phytophthora nicotianae]